MNAPECAAGDDAGFFSDLEGFERGILFCGLRKKIIKGFGLLHMCWRKTRRQVAGQSQSPAGFWAVCRIARPRIDRMENAYARVYGLTGVMGSGKSTAAKLLAEGGMVVLDADSIAREVVEPGSPYYDEIKQKLVAAFGPLSSEPLFLSDGRLNRAALAAVVFADRAQTARLNEIMHPPIQAEFARRVAAIEDHKTIIYDVPLLFEGGLHHKVKGKIVVYAPEQLCVARAVARAAAQGQNLSADEARARLRQQISIEEKRQLADHIIDNSGDLAALKAQVAGLCQKLE